MTARTEQALKCSASWTPNAEVGHVLMDVFNRTPAEGIKFAHGRMALKHAIAADYTDTAYMARVYAHLEAMKTELAESGTLHDWTVIGGAVPTGEAMRLPKPDSLAQAIDSQLPDGWHVDDGWLIVPNTIKGLKGYPQADMYERVRREDGKVLREPEQAAAE